MPKIEEFKDKDAADKPSERMKHQLFNTVSTLALSLSLAINSACFFRKKSGELPDYLKNEVIECDPEDRSQKESLECRAVNFHDSRLIPFETFLSSYNKDDGIKEEFENI